MSNSSNPMKVVLIGASGLIGNMVLGALLDSKKFEVTVLSRTDSKATFGPQVTVARTSYAEAELVEIFRGQEVVISTVGATGFGEQKGFIDAAIKAGVKRFIPSEFSSNTLSDAVRELLPLFEMKKAVLDYLREKESENFTWTAIMTGIVLDACLKSGFLDFDLANSKATIWDDGNIKFSAITEADMGKAVVAVLDNLDKTANEYLYVHTVAVSQNEILAALENATGRKWEVTHVESEKQIESGRELLAAGDLMGAFTLVKASAWSNVAGIRTNFAVDEKLENEKLGLAEGDLQKIVAAVVAA